MYIISNNDSLNFVIPGKQITSTVNISIKYNRGLDNCMQIMKYLVTLIIIQVYSSINGLYKSTVAVPLGDRLLTIDQ